jgi:type IV pilus assembly protein PilY1
MNIIADIINRMSSSVAVSVSLSTSQSQGEDRLVRAKFDPSGWKGYLEAYTIPYCDEKNKDYYPHTSTFCEQKPEWEAGARLGTETKKDGINYYDQDGPGETRRDLGSSEGKRMMYTYLGGTDRIKFNVDNISAVPDLYNALKGTSSLDLENAKALVCWTRGEYWVDGTDTFNPGTNKFLPETYNWLWSRDEGWRLFEIVYSGPLVAGAPNAWYGTRSYTEFAETYEGRERVTYVGDGGGSLHCFRLMDTKKNPSNWEKGGWEKWAYIPSNLLGQLQYKAEANYCHFSMVDLGSVKYDVYFPTNPDDGLSQKNNWRTVLIGGERSGGSQWFCLNITSPDCMTMTDPSPGSKTIFWEYEDRERLGDSYAYPEAGRIEDEDGKEKWLAFLTTGPQSTSTISLANTNTCPYIVALDIATVTVKNTAYKSIKVYDTAAGIYATPPLTSCSALDLKAEEVGGRFNNVIDLLYFGDSAGNIWKMKVGSTTDPWKPRIFFKAEDPLGQPQPISVSISIAFNKDYKPCLFFGSGRYLTKEDALSPQIQTFYSIIDKTPWVLPSTILKRINLNEMLFVDEVEGTPWCAYGSRTDTFYSQGTRTTIAGIMAPDPRGWFLDFKWAGCDGQTERVTEPALVYGGIVFFNSIIPDTEPCQAGGYGYFNVMKYLTGTIDKEIIEGKGMVTTICLGEGAPSRPIIDVQNSVVLTQMSTGEILRTPVKMPWKSAQIVNWGEEGVIECHVCKYNITHNNWRELK